MNNSEEQVRHEVQRNYLSAREHMAELKEKLVDLERKYIAAHSLHVDRLADIKDEAAYDCASTEFDEFEGVLDVRTRLHFAQSTLRNAENGLICFGLSTPNTSVKHAAAKLEVVSSLDEALRQKLIDLFNNNQ